MNDEELEGTFRSAAVPVGGLYDESVIPRDQFEKFHSWTMTDEQAAGVRVFLRALTPAAASGGSNFGGDLPDGG